jgi:uncharacterized membrane protein YphA (DoxX/SURF4 family)
MVYLLLRIKRFCGFLTGIVFFISGILKLMDPVGASMVMKEYYSFLHVSFMDPTALVAGVFFAFAEVAVGAALVTGVWKRIVAPVAIGLQGMFTLLTLFLVIFNPKMDCGCFGEAVHLTHSETFIKNIVLLVLLLAYYFPSRLLGPTRKKKYVSFGIVMASVAVFTVYSLMYIPLDDYTDYHAGVSLKSESLGSDSYIATFIYEKDGQQETFSIDNLPDSTWNFVSAQTTTSAPADKSSAVLSFYDAEGNYADHLLHEGKSIVISIYDTDIKNKDRNKIQTLIDTAISEGFSPIVLASDYIEPFSDAENYFADYKTLLTLNRSNGGATYIYDSIIIRKWAKKSLPDSEELAMIYNEDVTESIIGDSHRSLAFQGFLLYVFAVMLLL